MRKISIASILFISAIIPAAFAGNCTEIYEQVTARAQTQENLAFTGTIIGTASLAAGPIGLVGGASAASSVGVTASTYDPDSHDIREALALLQEAEVGDGLILREFAAKVDITLEQLVATILDMDSRRILCPSKPLGASEIAALIAQAKK